MHARQRLLRHPRRAPEAVADDVHYPGTYIGGVYNRRVTEVAGREVDNESLVNAPNWLPLRFRVDGRRRGSAREGTEVLSHRVELDMRRGVLTRRSGFRDEQGHVVRVAQRRFVSMRDPHLAALETTSSPTDWSGRLEVLQRPRRHGAQHAASPGTPRSTSPPRSAGYDPRGRRGRRASLVETNQSHIRIAQAARTRVSRDGASLDA